MRKLIWGSAAAIAALGLTLADFAAAQEPDPNVPVNRRPRPDYDPLGMRAGAFLIYPELAVEGGYDSNVFARKDDVEDDILGIVAPRLTAASQWSRHSLQLDAGAEAAFYRDFSDNNYQDFDAGALGRLDITRDDTLTGRLRFGRGHEGRDDPEDEGEEIQDDLTQFYDSTLGLTYRHDFNRVYAALRGDVRRLDYEDSGDINEDDRDHNRYLTGLRVGYRVSPRFDLFADAAYRWVDYDVTPNDAGDDRNNQGYVLRVGSGIDITSILFGEVYVGYTSVEYDDDDLDSVSAPAAGGELTWNVTALTSLIFGLEGQIKETTVTDEDGDEASGRLNTDASIEVWHELLRNVLLNGYVQYLRDDFEGISRTDDTYRAGAGVRYFLNRRLSLDGGYSFSTRESDVSDREYDRHQIRLGITAQL
jgi:hypothetical protein